MNKNKTWTEICMINGFWDGAVTTTNPDVCAQVGWQRMFDLIHNHMVG